MHGPPRSHVDPCRRGGDRQLLGREPQARRAAADRQPQGRGARGASERAAARPLDAQARAHRCRRGLSRGMRRAFSNRSAMPNARRPANIVTPRGELVVAAPIVFGRLHVLPVVNAFLATLSGHRRADWCCPTATLHLIDDHIDVAVRIGALADSSMVATRVGSVRCVVCASPRFLRSAWHAEDAGRSGRAAVRDLPASRRDRPGCSRRKDASRRSSCRCGRGSRSTPRRRPSTRRSPASASPTCSPIRRRARSRTAS